MSVHFCADCAEVLDVPGTHRVGVDGCPACGSTRVSATASPPTITVTAQVPQPTLTTVLDWATVWLGIADRFATAASEARRRFGDDPAALADEFHCGLIAVAAAAFAVEAEKRKVIGSTVSPTSPPQRRRGDQNTGDWLGQYLVEHGAIDDATAEALGDLFDRRNRSVHPIAKTENFVPHPAGTNTGPELVAYNADIARGLVAVAETVVDAIGTLDAGPPPGAPATA